MTSNLTTMDSLPNEILESVLSPLSTLDLLTLAPVNRRIYTIVLRLIQHRLATVVDGKRSKELILECYPPSAALSTPYLFCDFVETSLLDVSSSGALGDLGRLYSRFRPVWQDESREVGVVKGGAGPDSPPALEVHLDMGEPFAQLVTVTNLVKMASKRGQFLGHANVSDGVLRVWRWWLADAVAADGGAGKAHEAILWADAEKHVGVRFRVSEDAWNQHLLLSVDDDPAVSYRLEYQELVVRTSQLLLAVEKMENQVASSSGNDLMLVF